MPTQSISGLPMGPAQDAMQTVGKKELDRGDFMTMFITQLQYQDPMKPMESYEMASQLAQFSSMDATIKMSKSMDELLAYQKSQNNLQILGLLGNEVEIAENVLTVVDGKPGSASFSLTQQAEICQVDIFNSANQLVRSLDMGPQGSGSHTLDWDGKNSLGDAVGAGQYTYVVSALDKLGEKIESGYSSTGKVTGIRFEEGEPLLTVNDQMTIPLKSVVGVAASRNTPAQSGK